MQPDTSFTAMIDGHEATARELAPLAFAGFAHFTAMQVRDGRVRGLDLHLARLRAASMAMFGKAHADTDIRAFLRAALAAGPADLSLTATIFSRTGEFTPEGAADDPAILVRSFPPATGPAGPLALDAVPHQRPLAGLKHVGETMKTHALRRAVENGFDDAAFIDEQGRLAEATIWNLAFWDGTSILWPSADILDGITMQIVKRQLAGIGVRSRTMEIRLEDLGQFCGAALMNSWTPCVPVHAIGSAGIPVSDDFGHILRAAYEEEPMTSI